MNRRKFLARLGGTLAALGVAGCAEPEDDDFYEEEEDEEPFEDDLKATTYGAKEIPGVVTTVRVSE